MALRARSFTDLLAARFPHTELVKPRLLRRSGRMMIAGDTGLGKSYLTIQAAVSLALGLPLFETYDVVEPCRVTVVQFEVDEDELQERAQRVAAALGDPGDAVQFCTLWDFAPNDAGYNDLFETLAEHQSDVLIIDPVYPMLEGGDLGLKEVRQFMRWADKLIRATKVGLIATHHSKKDYYDGSIKVNIGMDALSGSKYLTQNWPNTVGILSGQRSAWTQLQWTKTRAGRGEQLPPLRFEWNNDPQAGPPLAVRNTLGGRKTDAQLADELKVRELLEGGVPLSRKDIATKLGIQETAVYRALKGLDVVEVKPKRGQGKEYKYTMKE